MKLRTCCRNTRDNLEIKKVLILMKNPLTIKSWDFPHKIQKSRTFKKICILVVNLRRIRARVMCVPIQHLIEIQVITFSCKWTCRFLSGGTLVFHLFILILNNSHVYVFLHIFSDCLAGDILAIDFTCVLYMSRHRKAFHWSWHQLEDSVPPEKIT